MIEFRKNKEKTEKQKSKFSKQFDQNYEPTVILIDFNMSESVACCTELEKLSEILPILCRKITKLLRPIIKRFHVESKFDGKNTFRNLEKSF